MSVNNPCLQHRNHKITVKTRKGITGYTVSPRHNDQLCFALKEKETGLEERAHHKLETRVPEGWLEKAGE